MKRPVLSFRPIRFRPLGLALGALIVIAFLARAWLVRGIHAPQLFCDEFIYADLAKSVVREGRPLLRGQQSLQNALYPVLIAPAWLAHSAQSAYSAAKTINVALMTSSAVLVYLWARRLVPPVHALVAATLTLAMPAFLYTDLLLSENAFMPAFVLAAFAIALALERPTRARHAFVLGTIAVAVAARTQALVLLPIFLSALTLKIAFDVAGTHASRFAAARREIRSHLPLLAALAAAGAAYIAYKAAQGQSLSTGLGPYQEVASAHYSIQAAVRWSVHHFEELVLAVGVFPVTALVIMAGLASRRNRVTTKAERSLLALTISVLVWLPVEAGLFASRFGGRLSERYTMYAIPLLILVLLLWIARGLPRPRLAAIVGIAIPVAAIFAFPLVRFLARPVYDSFTTFALQKAAPHLHGTDVLEWSIRIAAVAIAVGAVVLPRRFTAIGLPALLAAAWIVVSWPTQGFLKANAAGLRGYAPRTPDWIDNTIGDQHAVDYLYSASYDGTAVASIRMLETEFWNKAVRFVYGTDTAELCPLPERHLSFDAAKGRFASASPADEKTRRYLVAGQTFELSGKALAKRAPLTLYRIEPSLRVAQVSEGVFSDGWMGADAAFDFYLAPRRRHGMVSLRLAHEGWANKGINSATVRVGSLVFDSTGRPSIGKVTDTAFSESSGEVTKSFRLRTPPAPFRVEVHIYPAVSPLYVGQGTDPRGLGAVVDVRPVVSDRPGAP